MILTEESHAAYNTCTMESARSSAEEPVFGQTGGANEVLTTRYDAPPGWQNTDIGSSVGQLGNIAGHNIGPNTLQKVMAGDTVSASVCYYYDNASGGSNPNFVSTLVTSLGQAITGSGGASDLVKGNVTGITNGLGGSTGFINAVQPTGSGGTTPQAYLTVLFFDERFNFIEAADGGVLQQQVASSVGSNGLPIALGNIKAPKNGYVYVYVSNQSDQDVYFDNFKVGIARGRIIEENHYYAYGLKIAAISSTKAGDVNEGMLKNNYLYNDKELFDDADLDWYDYGFRNYDAQIGRFPQLDPLTDMYSPLTPYQYASCDPVTNIDIDGLEGGSAVGGAVGAASDFFQGSQTIMQSAVFVTAVKVVKATQSTMTFTQVALSITSIAIKAVVNTSNILNGKIETGQVGVSLKGSNSVNNSKTNSTSTGDGANDDWKPLYKSDLIRYAGTKDENVLGSTFEQLFATYSLVNPLMRMSNVRPNGPGKFTGGFRNTAPDFIGDAFVDEIKEGVKYEITIKGADWYELKQKTGGLYLSSNEDQIAGHIDNMRNNHDYAYRKYGRLGYQSKLYVVTTADVKFSPDIMERAFKNNVLYEHLHAEYKIVDGKWQFQFIKTVNTTQKW